MNRADLERLDRDALIARAEEAGVSRARVLTRPELVDELIMRSAADAATRQQARGLFGRARDLLARVVERGLHLSDAAERIRAIGAPLSPRPGAPAALPTVTLAEIYAAQGHRDRAVETLERVLRHEPDHAAAGALLKQLRDEAYAAPPPAMPPEVDDSDDPRRPRVSLEVAVHDRQDSREETAERDVEPEVGVEPAEVPPETARIEPPMPDSQAPESATPAAGPAEPMHMLDDAPLPPHYDVDECVGLAVDPTTLYVYWEARCETLAFLRARRPEAPLVLRVVAVRAGWDGPRSFERDHDASASVGETFVRDLPMGCTARVAIGLRDGAVFVPIAHSTAIDLPPGLPSPMTAAELVRWSVAGIERPGAEPAPVAAPDPRDADAVRGGVLAARLAAVRADRARRVVGVPGARAGGSENWTVTF